MTTEENLESSTVSSEDMNHETGNAIQCSLNQGDGEVKPEITEEEARSIIEVMATTGKFWHDWNVLKSLLSFRLKKVLAEYSESERTPDVGPQPSSLSLETYSEIVKRLDEALLSFEDGPPFTLQRLCEILLTPKSIYSSLSKLALALEKNLLVTSTLAICTDPYPSTTTEKLVEPDKVSEKVQHHFVPTENGVESIVGDKDEEMTDAEVEEDSKNSDMETKEQSMTETSFDEAVNNP